MSTPEDLERIGSLADDNRRAAYEVVASSHGAVGRDAVAAKLGIPRPTAAYHLDRLAEEGLLDVEFARLTGRTGPGAGRPAKLYRRAERTVEVSVPPRRYLLAARILLAAVADTDRDAALAAARGMGRDLAGQGLDDALVATGYEPEQADGEIRFRNCPFHALVEEDRATTCSLNLALVEGMVDGSGDGRRPRLQPEQGYCCVRLGR